MLKALFKKIEFIYTCWQEHVFIDEVLVHLGKMSFNFKIWFFKKVIKKITEKK